MQRFLAKLHDYSQVRYWLLVINREERKENQPQTSIPICEIWILMCETLLYKAIQLQSNCFEMFFIPNTKKTLHHIANSIESILKTLGIE